MFGGMLVLYIYRMFQEECPRLREKSVTEVWIQVFWVISVYFKIRDILPKSGTFLLGHPIYIYIKD